MSRVRIGLAAIPSRTDALRRVIESLEPQADEIFVSLNGFTEVPLFLNRRRIFPILAENIGDFQKFDFLEGFDGYYITCDDDIVYGKNYVEAIIDGIERYQRRAVVGWHGSIFKHPFKDYYSKESRSVYTFKSRIASDIFVDVLGTGCLGFHTDTIRPHRSIFERPSMADVYFAMHARKSNVPLVVIAHAEDVLVPIKTDISISRESIAESGTPLNVREDVTNLAHKLLSIPYIKNAIPVTHRPARIGVVGRFSAGRWRKGGIFKSCSLISKMVTDIGWESLEIEITGPIENMMDTIEKAHKDKPFDSMIIYTGDQDAQDFFAVPVVVDKLLEMRIPVAVNLSIDLDEGRDSEIRSFMNARLCDRNLFLMVFTEEIKQMESYSDIRDRMVVMPKTIQAVPNLKDTPFGQRSGVFLGDFAKLINPRTAPDALKYIKALKKELSGEKLYCVSYHKPDLNFSSNVLDMVEILPYTENIIELFSSFRVYVHLQRNCTFEMLPVEAISSGLPVAYVDMPQSLNEYIGAAGLRFTSPEDLARKASFVYRSPQVWKAYSRSGMHRASSLDVRHAAGRMGMAIRDMIERAKG